MVRSRLGVLNPDRLKGIARSNGASSLSLVWACAGSGAHISIDSDREYHAASTMKIAVLVSLLRASDRGELDLHDRLRVHNAFTSLADGSTYKVSRERGSNARIHEAVGADLSYADLALAMIATSSNLATNLLVERLGPEQIGRDMDALGIEGVTVRRGVDDTAAWRAGLNNTASAAGLANLLLKITTDAAASRRSCAAMRQILRAQRIRSGIPAGAPGTVEVANKTGDISTVVHDAAILSPLAGSPSILVVMTSWPGYKKGRYGTIARVTRELLAA